MDTPEPHENPGQRLRWGRWALLCLIALILLVSIVGWFQKRALAVYALEQWCGGRGWTCSAKVSRLDTQHVILEQVEVRTPEGTPVQIGKVDAALLWKGLQPQLASVTAREPIVRGRVSADGLDFYGLESLLATDGESEGGSLPYVSVTDGRVELQTPGGAIQATIQSNGRPFLDGRTEISFLPSDLQEPGRALRWSAGDLVLDFDNGSANGVLAADVEAIEIGDLQLEGTGLNLAISDADNQMSVEGGLTAATARLGSDAVRQLEGSWSVVFDAPPSLDADGLFAALQTLSIDAQTGSVASAAGNLAASRWDIDLAAGPNGGISGPLNIVAEQAETALADIGVAELNGQVDIADPRGEIISWQGTAELSDTALGADFVKQVTGLVQLPAPFDLHAQRMRQSLTRAAQSFDAAPQLRLVRRNDTLEITGLGIMTAHAATDLELTVDAGPSKPWLEMSGSAFNLSGDVTLSGGGAPDMQGQLGQLNHDGNTVWRLDARDVDLQPWTVSGRTASATMPLISMWLDDETKAEMGGRVTLSGTMPGSEFLPTEFAGEISAASTPSGWVLKTLGDGCIRFRSEGIQAGGVMIAAIEAPLCPEGGRLLSPENGQTVGQLPLGDIAIPFSLDGVRGTVALEDSVVQWFSDEAFRLTATGKSLRVPLVVGENTLLVRGAAPTVDISTSDGPVSIAAALAETDFSGTLIPVDASARAFRFSGDSLERGIVGQFEAERVRLSDRNEDPLFQPVIATLNAFIDGARVNLLGQIQEEARGMPLAETSLDIDILTLDGTGRIAMQPLVFSPNGLKPTQLSERLRGLLTNAEGEITGAADFTIEGGEVAGTGHVNVADLAFETFSFGRVSGVNGRIVFSDALGLKTPPAQRLTIGRMDVGLPLEAGEMLFQLRGPSNASLQSARWPLAGGILSIQPTDWRLGDPTHRVTVEAENIELAELIDVLSVPDLQATGTVSGTFPVDIEGANIFVRDARFTANAPGGTLSYTGSQTDAAAASNEYAAFAFDALKELQYSVMEIGANGNLNGDMLVTADILGRNPEVLGGAKFQVRHLHRIPSSRAY